jgi:ribulose bisphosphate carboxylase small subunit
MKKIFGAVVLLMIFCNSAVIAQDYDEDDIPYLTDEDMAALENTEWDIGALENVEWDTGEPEVVVFDNTPIEVKTSEMSRLNASQPIYHLLILDRLYSPQNSDISDTDGISILYKYRHGRNGYLVALYKSTAGGPVFPQLPDKSRVMADLVSVRVNTIREYIRSNAFKKFVTNRRVLSGMDAALRGEKPGSFQKIESETNTNEMLRLNASQPVYHLLILRRPLNADISDTDNIPVLYKYKHGRDGYLIVLYKSVPGGPVFPQLPDKSRVLANLMSVRVSAIREYIRSNAFRNFVTNRRIISDLDAVLLKELK